MKYFSSCCASTTFAKEMAMASAFSSLEYAISVTRDIWFRKVNVKCWLEAISGRSYSNKYLETANESTMQEKFGYAFVTCASEKSSKDILADLKTCFTNKYTVEFDITSREEMKYIELHITELLYKKSIQTTNKRYVSDEYLGEVVNDSLDEAETDPKDNLLEISSVGIDIFRQFNLNKVPEEDNETLDNQQRQHVHAPKRGFNLNKKPYFGNDLLDHVSCKGSRFLTKYFWPGQYDVEEKF
ncbi:hypothetical protein Ahy_B07g087745 [Arachis hypogaea]|uniref:Oxo-4-hydroxy-4-carboxy-5-ureidoimidazoline decarboxylase domain-containing protein n=1 Tax=Arachis hypogaea TaxID=3818 RepID=A0A444YCU7_ARAHY|nr:hypothetical protein Ahy_B07g087745 [Arachis hypogaea]